MAETSKNPVTSVRLPEPTRKQIDELSAKWGCSMANILTIAIDRMFQQETKTMNADYEQLARQRVNSDDDLGPEKDILLEYEWDNMTEHLEWVATANKDEILSWVLAIRDAENAVARNAEGE